MEWYTNTTFNRIKYDIDYPLDIYHLFKDWSRDETQSLLLPNYKDFKAVIYNLIRLEVNLEWFTCEYSTVYIFKWLY